MTEQKLLRIFRAELAKLILSQTACPNRQKAEMDAASEFFASEVSDLERYSKAYKYLAAGTSTWHKAGRIYFERTARKNARRIFDQNREEIATWYGNPASSKVYFQQLQIASNEALRLPPENDSAAGRIPQNPLSGNNSTARSISLRSRKTEVIPLGDSHAASTR